MTSVIENSKAQEWWQSTGSYLVYCEVVSPCGNFIVQCWNQSTYNMKIKTYSKYAEPPRFRWSS